MSAIVASAAIAVLAGCTSERSNVVETPEYSIEEERALAAIRNDDISALSSLVPGKVSVNDAIPSAPGFPPWPLVVHALYPDPKEKSLRYLVSQGADLSVRFGIPDIDGKPPARADLSVMRYCARFGEKSVEIAELLLSHGAPFMDETGTDTACLGTALSDRKLFDFFLSRGARCGRDLSWSSSRSDVTVTCSLVEEALQDNRCGVDMLECVSSLLPGKIREANPIWIHEGWMNENLGDYRLTNQVEKLHYAIGNGLQVDKLWESPKARLRRKPYYAGTLAHYAARAGFDMMLGVLLDSGADFSIVDSDGRLPVDILRIFPDQKNGENARKLLDRFP